ncbi:uncharacterized protein LOC115469623 [Microcaecilia unicolor]|uniref:ribonuclease H n=1 Tax=Microcaecilia unicolor TaxID=1415580 RepID=A0A6P7Y0E0_9AMPH|nr:uncharacterized protein LOC115469623 [Microcaecilia unicolor]
MHQQNLLLQQKLLESQAEILTLKSDLVMSQCEGKLMMDKCTGYQQIAERAAVRVAQYKYRKRRGRVSKVKVAKVMATATQNPNGWDPETWDGDIWSSTPESESGGEESAAPEMKPIIRRRAQLGGAAPVRMDLAEDYTQQEILNIMQQFQQRPNESLIAWCVRLHDTGAMGIRMDNEDCLKFIPLSQDAIIQSAFREHSLAMPDGNGSEATTLIELVGTGCCRKYPLESDWPGDDKPWYTLKDLRALIDTGAEATIIAGNPSKFKGPKCNIVGLGGKSIPAVETQLAMQIGDLQLQKYAVMITPVPEYIIGMDILRGLKLTIEGRSWQFGTSPAVPRRLKYISTYNIHAVLVGKIVDEPLTIPAATQLVAQKQYRIPGGTAEITRTIQELQEVGVIVPVTNKWNNPVWPVKKSYGSWRMTVDYRQLNKVTPLLHAAVPDIVTLIENIQNRKGKWYAVIDLANAFFTIALKEEFWEQFAFTWQGRQYTFTRLPQGWLHSPTICHRVVAQHLDALLLPPGLELTHYIDDILIQGDTEELVASGLEQLVQHMKNKGWEINPAKIQGPAQTVKFLGINWNKGHQEITEKALNKIAEFPVPVTKQQTQKFIGLFGFWRKHIPHLEQVLQPLYRVTRKKCVFQWGATEQQAFDQAKLVVQQSVSLWPIRANDPIELQVSVHAEYANWSMWQKQDGKRCPLGFWTCRLPDAAQRYIPFEKQLLACYWALVESEQLTLGHEVILRPEIPILTWINSEPHTHKIGHAQEASIIKWKWYIQNRQTKSGPNGVSQLHEQIAQIPVGEGEEVLVSGGGSGSATHRVAKWGVPYDQLTIDQRQYAWFTDGTAKYTDGKWAWKSVAYNPHTQQILQSTGPDGSSQYAELYAVYLVLKQNAPEAYIYTDSWAVANGLTTWLPTWKQNDWYIHTKLVWGSQLWQEISEFLQSTSAYVYHVDAHVSPITSDHIFNQTADSLATIHTNVITGTDDSTIHRGEEETGIASWAHKKCGHLGEQATYHWARQRGAYCFSVWVGNSMPVLPASECWE